MVYLCFYLVQLNSPLKLRAAYFTEIVKELLLALLQLSTAAAMPFAIHMPLAPPAAVSANLPQLVCNHFCLHCTIKIIIITCEKMPNLYLKVKLL